MAHELIARFKPGENVPASANTSGSPVAAGHFVKIAATKTVDGDYSIVHCTAAVRSFGVAERDSVDVAVDTQRTSWRHRVNIVRRGAIARVVAGAAVAAGVEVESDSTGRAITSAGTNPIQGRNVGIAAAAAGDIIEVDLY